MQVNKQDTINREVEAITSGFQIVEIIEMLAEASKSIPGMEDKFNPVITSLSSNLEILIKYLKDTSILLRANNLEVS